MFYTTINLVLIIILIATLIVFIKDYYKKCNRLTQLENELENTNVILNDLDIKFNPYRLNYQDIFFYKDKEYEVRNISNYNIFCKIKNVTLSTLIEIPLSNLKEDPSYRIIKKYSRY